MSKLLGLLPSPWLLLAVVALLLGAYGLGDRHGHLACERAVQSRWDAAEAKRAYRAAENTQRARDTEQRLQTNQNAERMKNAKAREALDRRLQLALSELRDRPHRPADIVPGAAGDRQGATGAGLFAEDADFALREAARADRQRLALAQCYRDYDAARDAIDKLNAGAKP